MTTQERPRANDTNLPRPAISSADDIKARITEWCHWFELEVPKVRTRLGQVYLTDALHSWLVESGASYDWIFCGDAKGMATVYKRKTEDDMTIVKAFRTLDLHEKQMMIFALRSIGKDVDGEVALAAFRVALDEYRATLPAEPALEVA